MHGNQVLLCRRLGETEDPSVFGVEPVSEELNVVASRHLEILYVGLGSIPCRRAGNIMAVHEVRHQLFLTWCSSESLPIG